MDILNDPLHCLKKAIATRIYHRLFASATMYSYDDLKTHWREIIGIESIGMENVCEPCHIDPTSTICYENVSQLMKKLAANTPSTFPT